MCTSGAATSFEHAVTCCGYEGAGSVIEGSRAFAGRVAVVTGVGSGIGRALTYDLAARGALLAVSDINDLQLALTAQHARSLGAHVLVDHLDVTDHSAMSSYAEHVVSHFGGAHLVVNNAGVVHVGDVLGMQLVDIERVMDTNFWGVVNGTMAFLPHLIASGGGHLVNISSLFGLIPIPTQSAYVASKFAVRGFTESLRIEMLAAKLPVKVTCVHPGGVNTAIARSGTQNAGAVRAADSGLVGQKLLRMPPEKAAAIILRAASRGRPRVLVGTDARAAYLLSSFSRTGWQRLAALGFGRMSASRSRPGSTGLTPTLL
jgi:NAD(P)-dependent dehydrogenase (short-subunit alcohol dehydrogenase family)